MHFRIRPRRSRMEGGDQEKQASTERAATSTIDRAHVALWGVAIPVMLVLAVAVVLTQHGFYEGWFGPEAQPVPEIPALNLAWLTPIALESLSWVFTVMSALAVARDKPSRRYEFWMWAFAALAAAVNAGHNFNKGAIGTALVLGLFSVAGPLVAHLALRWKRDANSELSNAEFRRAALVRLGRIARQVAQLALHPIKSFKAMRLYTAFPITWQQAYLIAHLGRREELTTMFNEQFDQVLTAPASTPVPGARVGAREGAHDAPVNTPGQGAHDTDTPSTASTHLDGLGDPAWARDLLAAIEQIPTMDEQGKQGAREHPDEHPASTPGEHPASSAREQSASADPSTGDEQASTTDDDTASTDASTPQDASASTRKKTAASTPRAPRNRRSSARNRRAASTRKNTTTSSGTERVIEHIRSRGLDLDTLNRTQLATDLAVDRNAVLRAVRKIQTEQRNSNLEG